MDTTAFMAKLPAKIKHNQNDVIYMHMRIFYDA